MYIETISIIILTSGNAYNKIEYGKRFTLLADDDTRV